MFQLMRKTVDGVYLWMVTAVEVTSVLTTTLKRTSAENIVSRKMSSSAPVLITTLTTLAISTTSPWMCLTSTMIQPTSIMRETAEVSTWLHHDSNVNMRKKSCTDKYICHFTEGWPEDCEWVGPVYNRYTSGYDDKTLEGVSADDCKAACEKEDRFNCRSFDYYNASRYCYLSMSDRYSTWLYESSDIWYYERLCNRKLFKLKLVQCQMRAKHPWFLLSTADLKNCWAEAKAEWTDVKYNRYMGSSFRTITNLTVAECKQACLQAIKNFRCISIDTVVWMVGPREYLMIKWSFDCMKLSLGSMKIILCFFIAGLINFKWVVIMTTMRSKNALERHLNQVSH